MELLDVENSWDFVSIRLDLIDNDRFIKRLRVAGLFSDSVIEFVGSNR
jgi:hypothetical protein